MGTLAVIILTKNEQENIVDVVQNAKQATNEVIIVDSGSTDNTVDLAAENGATVCFRAWDNDFAAQRNFGLTKTAADWVLYLDADERMKEEFVQAVKKVVATNKPVQGAMIRTVAAFGHVFKHGIFTPDKALRLFPRKEVNWVNKVHERPECKLNTIVLQGCVLHYTYKDWHQWVEKINRYTSIWANDSYAKGKRTTLATAFFHMAYGFTRALVLQAGFLDGWIGVFASLQHAYYTMLKYVKLYDLQRNTHDE